jgi:hypothetical protein
MNVLPDDTSYAGRDGITKKTADGFTAGPIESQPGAKLRLLEHRRSRQPVPEHQ